MTQLEKAAMMALRSLEWYVKNDDVIESMPGNEFWVKGKQEAEKAIQELRTAIQQAAETEPVKAEPCGIGGMAKTTCPWCENGFSFEYQPDTTERKGEPVDMGTWLWSKLADYCRRKGLNPHHENDLFNLAGELRSMLAHTSPQVPDYAWQTIADYEKDAGFKVNVAFETGWRMARTMNSMFKEMDDAARKGE